jgi:hypothetical protein
MLIIHHSLGVDDGCGPAVGIHVFGTAVAHLTKEAYAALLCHLPGHLICSNTHQRTSLSTSNSGGAGQVAGSTTHAVRSQPLKNRLQAQDMYVIRQPHQTSLVSSR